MGRGSATGGVWGRGGVAAVVCWLVAAGCGSLPVGAISPLTLQAELLPTSGANFDTAGRVVAVSGDGGTALVASPNYSGARGRVTVFMRVGTTWSQQTHLLAGDASVGDSFGYRVALSANGNTALISAPYKTASSGAAYVFTRTGATWAQTGILTAPIIAANEQFGAGVALAADGATAAVGIPRRGVGMVAQAGAVQLFTRSGNTYAAGAALALSDAQEYDTLGAALALSADGGVLVAGVEVRANNTGATYAFTRGGGGAYTAQSLALPTATPYASFGRSVAVSGDGATALVGEPGRTTNGRTNAGAAYQFNRDGGGTYGTAITLASPDAGAFDAFGSAVALSGDGTTAAVSAPGYNSNVGRVSVASRTGAAFAIVQTIGRGYMPGSPPDFGASLALSTSGTTAVIGAPGRATNTGGAYVFAGANPAPLLGAISPPSGPVAGGARVTITGANFRPGMTVAFDGVPAASVTYVSATQIVAVAPAHITGRVGVTVASADGQLAALPDAFAYVNAAPAPHQSNPMSGAPAPAPLPHAAPPPPGSAAPNPAPPRR